MFVNQGDVPAEHRGAAARGGREVQHSVGGEGAVGARAAGDALDCAAEVLIDVCHKAVDKVVVCCAKACASAVVAAAIDVCFCWQL